MTTKLAPSEYLIRPAKATPAMMFEEKVSQPSIAGSGPHPTPKRHPMLNASLKNEKIIGQVGTDIGIYNSWL